jgi:malate dehydrogenase (oxaloacetate-decarboxylating)(NADP+)
MNGYKAYFASDTGTRTLAEAMYDADVFVGLSVGNIVSTDMLRSMAARPIVFALANPDPEIEYGEAKVARPDAIVATGRSDHPNQVNNVLAFPSVFRAALDVRARTIDQDMQIAAARAIAALAREKVTRHVLRAYGRPSLAFGPKYILPKPLDPRLVLRVAPAVARAALASGAARVPIDIERYPADLAARLSLRAEAGEILNVAAEAVAATCERPG